VLYGCYRIMEYDIAAVWCYVGYASISDRDVGELEGAKMQSGDGAHLENSSPLCLMWCLWKGWNACSFDDCETSSLTLKKLVIQTLFTWRVMLHSMFDCSFPVFIDLCYSFFFGLVVSYIHPMYFGLRPSAFFFFFFIFIFKYTLLIIKKKEKKKRKKVS
jgi:hypothetical protein